ncbi:hypothetical protein A2U01_0084505, partial [Trifolium medium]|nr:hypothetical protein [Trifolium medium]
RGCCAWRKSTMKKLVVLLCPARGAAVPARGTEVVSRAALGAVDAAREAADLVYIRKISFLVPCSKFLGRTL